MEMKKQYSRNILLIQKFFTRLIHTANTDILIKKKIAAEAGM